MCNAWNTIHKDLKFHFDEVIALNVVVATYDDIDRYKSYHLRNSGKLKSDVVKRTAYFTKWTTKLRPVMFVRSDVISAPSVDPDMGLMVNEILAVSWATELISSDLGRDVSLTLKSRTELLYDLHYRGVGSDALLAWFQAVVDLARAGFQNPIIEFGLT
ncbi:MAG TPA: hypothetical protein VG166_03825 [Caulobacteraceae bacterium]|jgi:hypothetical protein|nr:hypothetical protein [Caulobacteraceae bacterium]